MTTASVLVYIASGGLLVLDVFLIRLLVRQIREHRPPR